MYLIIKKTIDIAMKFCILLRLTYFPRDNLVKIKDNLIKGPKIYSISDSDMKIFDEQC